MRPPSPAVSTLQQLAQPITRQEQLTFAPDGTALVGSGSDLYWQKANGWRRQRIASQAAPITALWAGAVGYLVALTDKLAVCTDGERWETAVWLAGEPVVALTAVPSTNTLLAGAADGRLWQTTISNFIDT